MYRLSALLTIVSLLLMGNFCSGQPIPKTGLVFEDDFSNDLIGTFPSKWRISAKSTKTSDDSNSINKRYFTVQKENTFYSLTASRSVCMVIEPGIKPLSIRSDNLSIDFDFLFESSASLVSLMFCSQISSGYCSELIFFIRNEKDGGISLESYCWDNKYFKGRKTGLPVASLPASWHHFRITFNDGTIKCFIDRYRLAAFPSTGYFPASLAVGIGGISKFTRFRITSSAPQSPFDKILTENKLVTRAINFEVNQSAILPGSIDYIRQLAEFLKVNPNVKLEIDGHTDAEGNPASNLELSRLRANVIRNKLVSMGIDSLKLTARGYGATKPFRPNTTKENKAINRRVEFIRID